MPWLHTIDTHPLAPHPNSARHSNHLLERENAARRALRQANFVMPGGGTCSLAFSGSVVKPGNPAQGAVDKLLRDGAGGTLAEGGSCALARA